MSKGIERYSFQESMDMIFNEKKCVDRADKNKCNRDCANCDLVKVQMKFLKHLTRVILLYNIMMKL